MLAARGGSTCLGMKLHPWVRMAWERRPGVVVFQDQASFAWRQGFATRTKAM